MMTTCRLVNYVAAEPFRPFRVRMASGARFDIRHPEMIQVGCTTATIFNAMDTDEASREREREVSIILIESIEPLEKSSVGDET